MPPARPVINHEPDVAGAGARDCARVAAARAFGVPRVAFEAAPPPPARPIVDHEYDVVRGAGGVFGS